MDSLTPGTQFQVRTDLPMPIRPNAQLGLPEFSTQGLNTSSQDSGHHNCSIQDITQFLEVDWQSRGYLPKNEKVLLAVSGGRDSMVLLHYWISQVSPLVEHGVVYIDHGFRPEARFEGAWILKQLRILEAKLKCPPHPFHLVRLQANFKPGEKLSEDWARRERTRHFLDLKGQWGYKRVLTAHHLGDLEESIWMSLGRGSGLRGLTGPKFFRQDGICRPFLGLDSTQMKGLAKFLDVSWLEDKTNRDLRYFRNWVREIWIKKFPDQARDMERLAHLATECLELGEVIWSRDWIELDDSKVIAIFKSKISGPGGRVFKTQTKDIPPFESLDFLLLSLDKRLTYPLYQEICRQAKSFDKKKSNRFCIHLTKDAVLKRKGGFYFLFVGE